MAKERGSPVNDTAALIAAAEAGGPGAALAARRAAALLERTDPGRARQALALAADLAPLDPGPRLALARLKAEAGELDQAAAEAKRVLAEAVDQAARARAAFMLGEIARAQGDQSAARGLYGQTLEIEDGLLAANRSDPTAARWYARARGRIAELDAAAGERARAASGAEAALALLRAAAAQIGETPALAADIADAELRLGALELDSNQPSSARRRFSEAIGRYEALAVTEQHEPHWRAVLSDAWALAAEADYVRGAAEQARTAMDKALQARLRLAAGDPQEAWGLAGAWRVRAALRAALGDADAAAESLTQARALAEQLRRNAADGETGARFLTHTLLEQADHALRSSDIERAREAADRARMLAEMYARKPEASPIWLADAANCWDRLGETARAVDDSAKTLDAFARAVELRRRALRAAGDDLRYKRGLAASLLKFGEAALDAGVGDTARGAFQESASLRSRLLERTPDDPAAALALAVALERLGLTAKASGDLAAARAAWEDELALAYRIFGEDDLAGVRFCAVVEAHLAGAGGRGADEHRRSSLQRFDVLARAGVLTEREAALRRKLWGG